MEISARKLFTSNCQFQTPFTQTIVRNSHIYGLFITQLHSIFKFAHPPNLILLSTNLVTSLNNCDWQETPSSKSPGNSTDRQCLKGTDIAIRLPAGLKDNSKVISLDNVYYLILGLIRAHMWETHHLK